MPIRPDPFLTGRETMYEGIKMRSRLEAGWAAYLDGLELPWVYEPMCFANRDGQYLPDFRVTDGGSAIYLEVKGVLADHEEARRRMEIVWDSEPAARLVIVVGPPTITPVDGLGDDFWHVAREWALGTLATWLKEARVREWELYSGGPLEEGIDYEMLIEGRDW